MSAIVWFRRDLRLRDNPAWAAATTAHDHVRALFILDRRLWDHAGPHRGPQLVAHLEALDQALAAAGGRLQVRHGDPATLVPELADGPVYWNADYSPFAAGRDARVAAALGDRARVHHGSVVHRPGTIQTAAGAPVRVFTPYHRRWDELPLPEEALPGSAQIDGAPGDGIPAAATPLVPGGEEAAMQRLAAFLDRVDEYPELRDRPDLDATSRISADLKFGTLSPRTVVETVGTGSAGKAAFVRQIAWRDFYAHILHHHPATVDEAMRPEYDAIAWRADDEGLAAWKQGLTGYPIVDAGMRQLLSEGWMHNRVRMIAASFLVKDLLIDWRHGERHFRRLLLDGDVAQNVGNWQWTAGTGVDAAPYFRVFNPVLQSKKFDPDGAYIRRHVPELAEVPTEIIHAPWEAGPLELAAVGVTLGDTYPAPLVDHAEARRRALDAYSAARDTAT